MEDKQMSQKGFKAYNKGLKCMNFQYEENKTFEMDKEPSLCNSGFHYCENPLDTLNYYPLVDGEGNISEFTAVEALGKTESKDYKSVTNKIKIGAKLDLKAFIGASIEFLFEKTKQDKNDGAQLASSGNGAKLASSGYGAQLAINGDNGIAMCCGRNSSAKGKKGSWIVLAEWAWSVNTYVVKNVKAVQIDGEILKEDTYYFLMNGDFEKID